MGGEAAVGRSMCALTFSNLSGVIKLTSGFAAEEEKPTSFFTVCRYNKCHTSFERGFLLHYFVLVGKK